MVPNRDVPAHMWIPHYGCYITILHGDCHIRILHLAPVAKYSRWLLHGDATLHARILVFGCHSEISCYDPSENILFVWHT
jgi:hypothetical protein